MIRQTEIIPRYTLEEARLILEQQRIEDQMKRIEERIGGQTERNYYRKQKIMGMTLILVSIVASIISTELTAALFLLPLGCLLLFTKSKVLVSQYTLTEK